VLSYNVLKYQFGLNVTFGQNTPLFLDLGFLGDHGANKSNAPSPYSHNGPYIGLGLKF
jgi:hypothetical protein